ncbi:MAG TPA: glutamine--fructose-6-phosphate transaminase (isomerizing) [Candidatus Atribacteria bacterium]|nr:glutamine--fructose-6-phosphate transaminase (isomerizing) [Candidatus Atribacteria bacterium]
MPSRENAHPHLDCAGDIALVHNGIIENYRSLRFHLSEEGHAFKSETDSEVIVHLLEGEGTPLERLIKAVRNLKGSFALCIIFREDPGAIYGVRMSSPLILGVGNGENFLASDIPAFLQNTNRVVFLEDGEIVRVTRSGWEIFDFEGRKKPGSPVVTVPWDPVSAEKGGYKHFMLKEIHEQPQVFEDTLAGRLDLLGGQVCFEELEEFPMDFERVVIVACGTACHAGMLGRIFLEKFARIPTEVDYASEFRYRDPLVDSKTLVLSISQSGETADTLAAVSLAREKGCRVVSICNVLGSSLTRISDWVLYTRAGVEISVASTKAFLCQMAVLLLFAIYLGQRRGLLGEEEMRKLLEELVTLPRLIREIFEQEEDISKLAKKFYLFRNFLYIGRGVLFPLALEGALKLKEISYIHAEGLSAGEMKHGPIALVEPGLATFVLVGQDVVRSKIISNMEEIKARQGKIIALCCSGDQEVAERADEVIYIPRVTEYLLPFLAIVPMQLFAYYVALEKGCDVDQPRNLAKSVTVE